MTKKKIILVSGFDNCNNQCTNSTIKSIIFWCSIYSVESEINYLFFGLTITCIIVNYFHGFILLFSCFEHY
jgi:hypothetical protein